MKGKLALSVLLTMFIISCGDDAEKSSYKCSSCVDSPEALAANDNSGKGIYKGVFIGSSGTLKINIDNEGNGISATLVLDGEVVELETESTYNSESGFNGNFYNDNNTETPDDDFYVGFYVNTIGSFGISGMYFPSHDRISLTIEKETSEALIMAFEGTFSGSEKGIWNLITIIDEDGNGHYAGVGRPEGKPDEEGYFEGAIQNFEMMGGDFDIVVTGTIEGDNAKGNWEVDGGGSGSWKAKRTL